ncbi:SH3 domain-containing protein, partial [Streptomyces hirsutus]|uniref:SH3 domain-containing protein n=1 Tax=Streptomyces hirsutus TaxID=35620 RepID=UPI0006E24C58
ATTEGAATTTEATATVAADGNGGGGGNGRNDNGGGHGNGNGGGDNGRNDNGGGGNHGDHSRHRGVITAPSLALRTSPDRDARVIRYVRKGDVVSLYCKVGGDNVQGNPLWYLVTDGRTWAWGAARHINNIGPAPRWC